MRAGVLANYHIKVQETQQQIELSPMKVSEEIEPALGKVPEKIVHDKTATTLLKRKADAAESVPAVQVQKKRKVNISFGLDSDSDEED
jgi:hypothetical protein